MCSNRTPVAMETMPRYIENFLKPENDVSDLITKFRQVRLEKSEFNFAEQNNDGKVFKFTTEIECCAKQVDENHKDNAILPDYNRTTSISLTEKCNDQDEVDSENEIIERGPKRASRNRKTRTALNPYPSSSESSGSPESEPDRSPPALEVTYQRLSSGGSLTYGVSSAALPDVDQLQVRSPSTIHSPSPGLCCSPPDRTKFMHKTGGSYVENLPASPSVIGQQSFLNQSSSEENKDFVCQNSVFRCGGLTPPIPLFVSPTPSPECSPFMENQASPLPVDVDFSPPQFVPTSFATTYVDEIEYGANASPSLFANFEPYSCVRNGCDGNLASSQLEDIGISTYDEENSGLPEDIVDFVLMGSSNDADPYFCKAQHDHMQFQATDTNTQSHFAHDQNGWHAPMAGSPQVLPEVDGDISTATQTAELSKGMCNSPSRNLPTSPRSGNRNSTDNQNHDGFSPAAPMDGSSCQPIIPVTVNGEGNKSVTKNMQERRMATPAINFALVYTSPSMTSSIIIQPSTTMMDRSAPLVLLATSAAGRPVQKPSQLRHIAPKTDSGRCAQVTTSIVTTTAQSPPKTAQIQRREENFTGSIPPVINDPTANSVREEILNKCHPLFRRDFHRKMSLQSDEYFRNVDSDGDSILHIMTANGSVDESSKNADELRLLYIVEQCIHRGIDILNSVNNTGESPLMCAATTKQIMKVRLLLEKNANPNVDILRGNNACTILHLVAALGDPYVEVARVLCKSSKIHIDSVDRKGMTPLLCAVESHGVANSEKAVINSEKMIKLLLDHGAALDFQVRRTGDTAFHCAVRKKSVALVEMMCRNCHKDIEKTINISNFSRWTPLHVAAILENLEMEEKKALINVLIAYKASPSIPNMDGKTPTDFINKNIRQTQGRGRHRNNSN